MAEINQRISEIRAYFCENNNKKFADMLGKSHTYTSGLCGNENVGKAVIETILSVFPEVSRSWLVTGEGAMLSANSNTEVAQLKERIAELELELKKKDATIDRLVRILDSYQQPQAVEKKDVG